MLKRHLPAPGPTPVPTRARLDARHGYAGAFDVITAITGFEMALKGMGHPVKLVTGVAADQELLMA